MSLPARSPRRPLAAALLAAGLLDGWRGRIAIGGDDVAELDALAATVGVAGDRYDAAGMAAVGL